MLFSQDILYNKTKRNGLLYEKIRYNQRKFHRKQIANFAESDKKITENDEKEIDGLIKYFNQCILPRDKSEVMQKLKMSAEFRKNKKNNNIFTSVFHLYRVDPNMVKQFLPISFVCHSISFCSETKIHADFGYMYEDKDPDILIKKWKHIEKKPFELFKIVLDRNTNTYHRDAELHNFLTFLKAFPSHKSSFKKSCDSLILFCEVIEIFFLFYLKYIIVCEFELYSRMHQLTHRVWLIKNRRIHL